MSRPTSSERYQKQGLQAFTCWLKPETIQTIKDLAHFHNIKIPEVLERQFGAKTVKVEKKISKGRVSVTFSKENETDLI